MLKKYNKPALTFEQQLNHLVSRGLQVDNHSDALQQLASISYYRLSAYWYPFRKRNIEGDVVSFFVPHSNFKQVIDLYEFDRKLRLLVLDALERVEVSVRTQITYHMGHKYGAFGYLDPQNFHERFNHTQWISRLNGEIHRSSDEFVNHYKTKYTDFPNIPIWMLTEVMSFGSLSFFYEGLRNARESGIEDKRIVADYFNLHHKRLGNWLHTLTYVRNVCAHHSRLWNRKLAIRPDKAKQAEWLPPVTPRSDRIFYILLILRQLLRVSGNGNEWAMEVSQLIKPIIEIDSYRIAMGIPGDWVEHPIWK